MRTAGRGSIILVLMIVVSSTLSLNPVEQPKQELDKVIEDELTEKLSIDLLQSIERKFQMDLEKSVDMVLVKIKILLENGTTHVQDKLVELQGILEQNKSASDVELEKCLLARQNETSALAEKALHQMVVCGYALIGHDPSQAITRVMALKNMINQGVKPLYEQKKEVYDLIKVCGHDHDTLKKVIKCVISKSPFIKSAMMDITNKLIDGVVDLTKLMAHGAMHEACLIEVIRTTEDEAFEIVNKAKNCANGNITDNFAENAAEFIADNNATVIDINLKTDKKPKKKEQVKINADDKDLSEMKNLIRRMLSDNKGQELDKKFKKKLVKLQKDLGGVDNKLAAEGGAKNNLIIN